MSATRSDRQTRGASSASLRKLSAAVAFALLAASSLGTTGCQRLVDLFKAKQLIRQGNAYFKEQLYEDALKKYEEAQKLDPSELRIKKFRAMANMAIYNPGSQHEKDLLALETAIKLFKEYLAVKPDDEKAAKYLVTTYMNAQRYDDAIGYFKDWFTKHPDDKQAVQTIAMLYAKKGDFDQSMEWQHKHAKVDPNNAEVYYTMGVTCWDKAYNTPQDQLDPVARKKIVDDGMAALQKATTLRADYFEAMLYVNLMFREYAKLTQDPAEKEKLIAEATEWQTKALAARERVKQKEREEAFKKNPLEAI